VDIPPTLVQEYLGCTNDVRDYSDGLNLFSELPEKRPLVAASYFNHAFIIDDNVYAVYPVYTKKYKLADINRAASRPPVGLLKELMADITRFYDGETRRDPDFATR
jgi:membrane-anchored protein YejM (alkaline phosphatase superfamily)